MHELDPIGLERGVPLTVPVGVRDDPHLHRSVRHRVRLRPREPRNVSCGTCHLSVTFRLQFVHTTAQDWKPRFLTVP